MEELSLGKYVIVYLIKGKAKEYSKNLANKIYKKFEVFRVLDSIDMHITFKYVKKLRLLEHPKVPNKPRLLSRSKTQGLFDFNILLNDKQVKKIENILEDFCKTHKKAKLKLKGIGHFDNRVIFIDVEPSKEMNLIYKNLVKKLERLPWISWHEYEKENIHFHSTLAEKGIENKFEEIFCYTKKENPDFELELDNLCILAKQKDKWILHKEFLLKN